PVRRPVRRKRRSPARGAMHSGGGETLFSSMVQPFRNSDLDMSEQESKVQAAGEQDKVVKVGARRMNVARGDDGGARGAKRPMRRPPDQVAVPAVPRSENASVLKLDDLYRLPMPKLFAFAEREIGRASCRERV